MEVLTVEEIAEIIKVDKRLVYKLLTSQKLKGRKVGREWRVLREDLEAYMKGEQ